MSDPYKIPLPTGMQIAGSLPPFSLGICSHQPERVKEACFHWQRGLSDLQKEVPTLCATAKSMAEGYNQILEQCQTEYLILSHHDAWPISLPYYVCGKRLLERMSKCDLMGFAGASRVIGPRWFDHLPSCYGGVVNYPSDPPGTVITPEMAMIRAAGMRPCQTTVWGRQAKLVRGIRVMDGYCMIMRADEAKKIKFDTRYPGFHFYDLDFSLYCHTAGLRTAICTDIYISHNSTGSYMQSDWLAGVEIFLKKWKSNFDGTITGVGKSAIGYGSGDARLVLLELQREEKLMQEEIDASVV